MISLKNLEDIQIMCRMCLTPSENMISFDAKLDDKNGDSPLIIDVLEDILTVEVNCDVMYPKQICHMCYGSLKISYDMKIIFSKSQHILQKYISLLEMPHLENLKDNIEDENSQLSVHSMDNYDTSEILQLKVEDNHFQDIDKTNKFKREIEFEENELFEIDESQLPEINENELPEVDESMLPEIDENVLPEMEESSLVPSDSKKIVKLQINKKSINTMKVRWVDENKFLMERKKRKPQILYKCTICHKKFLFKDKLSNHACKPRTSVKCNFCNQKFLSNARKEQHIRLKHESRTSGSVSGVKCEICGESFKNYNAKSYHKLTRHNEEGKKFACEVCGKAFYIKNSLNQHMECHTKDVSRVVCPICGKGFHYRGGLFYHMKIHRNERNYICTFCNTRFLTMASLKRHTRIHTGERPYACSICSKTFCSVSEVRTHEKRHSGQKPHQCIYCKKSFLTPYNLKLHISSHPGTQPCDFCDKRLLNSEALKYHMDIKHNIRDKKPTIEVVVTDSN